jgi:hypothetical protein
MNVARLALLGAAIFFPNICFRVSLAHSTELSEVTLIFDRRGVLVYKRFGVIDREQIVSEVEHLRKS